MNTERDTLFISHATPEDNDFTIWLASRLQLLGYKIWIDKNALVGGEKFWESIDQTIRNNAVKFLLVYSKNICQAGVAGKLKDGISKEFSLAESIAKQNNLSDFILLMNIDASIHNLFIGADRLNQISFHENWADGLKQLEKKLVKDHVLTNPSQPNEEFIQWFKYQYIVSNPIVEKKELYYANIWPIERLPEYFYIHQFRKEEQAQNLIEQHKDFPLSKIANNVSSFEGDLLYNSISPLDYTPEKIFAVRITDVLNGYQKDSFPTQKDAENHLKSLLKRIFHQIMKNRGMFWYEMANKRLAYFYTPANLNGLKVKFTFPYRKNGVKTKNLIGIYKKIWKWHYGVSAKPILHPIVGFSLKNHLVFTDDGFKVWKNEKGDIDTDKIHSHRRSKGKMFFNEEWRDMFLAFLHGLKNSAGQIEIPLANNSTLNISPNPEMFWSSFGYFDPKDKTRQGMLSTYEEDEDELNHEENG